MQSLPQHSETYIVKSRNAFFIILRTTACVTLNSYRYQCCFPPRNVLFNIYLKHAMFIFSSNKTFYIICVTEITESARRSYGNGTVKISHSEG